MPDRTVRRASALRLAETAARRRDHRHGLPRLQHRLVAGCELFDPAAQPPHEGAAEFAGFAALQPEGTDLAVGREDGALHGLQEPDGAARAVARAPAPAP